ncbi:hypothetical protein FA95DRAFT_1554113 [Auriscalpium vulgare]|uniref:Uncharacterized protein n=1 Tax=Auriscalpium vulgare TaxID=40419 RepID=A0ACB8S6Z6_9AGAM|nr:hypothetical protein FA95DRAFT_1554113 [Auriscalpium vulgare]
MASLVSHLTPLHGLVQLVNTKSRDFVVLSTVAEDLDTWDIHVGLTSGAARARWWKGSWNESDVQAIAGSHTSPKMLAAFALRLADTIVRHDISIDYGDDMKFTLGPKAKKPLHVDLREMSTQAAAEFAAHQFLLIARDAQSRDCRFLSQNAEAGTSRLPAPDTSSKRRISASPDVEPDVDDSPARPPKKNKPSKGKETDVVSSEDELVPPSQRKKGTASSRKAPPKSASHGKAKTAPADMKGEPTDRELAALAEVRALKAQLAQAAEKERELTTKTGLDGGSIDGLRSRAAMPAAVQRRPGASLANPNQKARRVQAVEFASDSD